MTQTQAEARHAELVGEIHRHDHAYYVLARPAISDFEYDKLFAELQELEKAFPELITPESPTSQVPGDHHENFRRVELVVPMLSLENTYSEREVRAFISRVERLLPTEKLEWVVEPKIDGVAVSLKYVDGVFVQGLTRGQRELGQNEVKQFGDDITANLQKVPSIPRRLNKGKGSKTDAPAVLEVRGEVYMTKAAFADFNAQLELAGEAARENPRNAVTGSLKQKNPEIAARCPLRIVLYGLGVVEGATLPRTQIELLDWLANLGLDTPERRWLCHSADEVLATISALDQIRHRFAYQTDGAVIKLNIIGLREMPDIRTQPTDRFPKWAKAYKYRPEQAETKLLGITIQVGRTGVLTPVAELEPVLLAGSTISRATLHNEEEIRRKDIRIGDTVIIEKAGDVIPAVVQVVPQKRPPTATPLNFFDHAGGKCPACSGTISRDPEFVAWRCANLNCPAQKTRRLEFFAKRGGLDIVGIGGVVADRLVESGLVSEPLDVFDLQPEQLAALNLGTAEEPRVFGMKNTTKVLRALERARAFPLSRWLHALAIPEVGETTAFQLAKFHTDLEELAESKVLKDVCLLEKKCAEALKANPRSTNDKPRTEEERIDRLREFEQLKQEIETIGAHLESLGFAKQGKSKGPISTNYTCEVGPGVAQSVLAYFASDPGRRVVKRLKELGIAPKGARTELAKVVQVVRHSIAGKTFVLTGTLPTLPRDEASALIREAGGDVTSSVSKSTDYVLAGENAGSKLAKADEFGVKIISEEQFRTMLGASVIPMPTADRSHSSTPVDSAAPGLATNRQKKVLRFFGIPFGPKLSVGAAGLTIDELMADEANREKWRKYLFLTQDFDADSDQLKPFSTAELDAVQVPEGWSGQQAITEFKEELAARIIREESPFDHPQPKVVFKGKTFLFTGNFAFGSRKECQKAVTLRGGIPSDQKQVSHSIDYVVVGSEGSKAWSKGDYGNKIESAILARRQHGAPAIISEEHWVAAVKEIDPQLSLLDTGSP